MHAQLLLLKSLYAARRTCVEARRWGLNVVARASIAIALVVAVHLSVASTLAAVIATRVRTGRDLAEAVGQPVPDRQGTRRLPGVVVHPQTPL